MRFGRHHGSVHPQQSRRFHPAVERLEGRLAPAPYKVTPSGDDGGDAGLGDPYNVDSGDVRFCVNAANDNPGADTIVFKIPGAGVHTIGLKKKLSITDPVTMDGITEQQAAAANTAGF